MQLATCTKSQRRSRGGAAARPNDSASSIFRLLAPSRVLLRSRFCLIFGLEIEPVCSKDCKEDRESKESSRYERLEEGRRNEIPLPFPYPSHSYTIHRITYRTCIYIYMYAKVDMHVQAYIRNDSTWPVVQIVPEPSVSIGKSWSLVWIVGIILIYFPANILVILEDILEG